MAIAKKPKDQYTRQWIIQNAVDVIERYEVGVLTIRALHYQLVGLGMTNTMQHYKRVVEAMIQARWDGTVNFEVFSDHDREVLGKTANQKTTVEGKVDTAKWAINHYIKRYYKKPLGKSGNST